MKEGRESDDFRFSRIFETVQYWTKVLLIITGSRICAFDWFRRKWPWITLHGSYVLYCVITCMCFMAISPC